MSPPVGYPVTYQASTPLVVAMENTHLEVIEVWLFFFQHAISFRID